MNNKNAYRNRQGAVWRSLPVFVYGVCIFRIYGFTSRAAFPTVSSERIFLLYDFIGLSTHPTTSGGGIFSFYVFTNLATNPATSGGTPRAFPTGTPSFVARRKITEKGVPRGCGPLNPLGLMFWRMPDVLCAYVFATVRLTRLSRLRCREANTLGVRSAYPLASACCTATKDSHISKTTRLSTSHNVGQLRKSSKFPQSLRGALVRRGNPRPLTFCK